MPRTRVVAAATMLAVGLALLPATAVSQPTLEPVEGAFTSSAMLLDWDTAPKTDAQAEEAFKQLQAEAATRPLEDIIRERNEAVHKKWAEEAKTAPRQHYTTDADDLIGS